MADALVDATKKNDTSSVKKLTVGGVGVNGVDRFGCTALFYAADRGFVECAKVLLEANADVEKANHYGNTPLHRASQNRHVECVKLLINWKANLNARTDLDDSPLHLAAREGDLACIEILIQAGAALDARNIGMTSLALAILNNEPDVAELLLGKGAKISNVHESIEIPDWVNGIIAKRQHVRRGLLAFIGVLRKRFAVSGGGTEYTRGRLPRDVVGVISKWAWTTRFDKRWEVAVPETVNKL